MAAFSDAGKALIFLFFSESSWRVETGKNDCLKSRIFAKKRFIWL
jgi:hypothetical protein